MIYRVVKPVSGFLIVSTMAVALATGAANAQQECQEFTLVGGKKNVHLIDNGESGDSAGDLRVVTRPLLDEQGAEYGELKVVSTVTGAGRGDGDTSFLGAAHFIFRIGDLVGQASYQRPNDKVDANPETVTYIITGGSGIYKGATGTVEVAPGDDPTFSFKIDCG